MAHQSAAQSVQGAIDVGIDGAVDGGISTATFTLANLVTILTPFALNVIGAILVMIIGLWLVGRLVKIMTIALERSDHIDITLRGFLISVARYGLIALVIITTLGVFGVPTTSFAALIGAIGLAIGLALQGTLGHMAAGLMLLAFRPFEIGDFIEAANHKGTVKKLSLFTTELASSDNKKIIIPNSAVWASSIVNYSAYGERRLDLVFSVSYNDDLSKTLEILRDQINQENRILNHHDTAIAVDNLGASSIDIICRPWVMSADYSAVKWSLTKQIKEQFDKAGITIPYPTRQIITTNPDKN